MALTPADSTFPNTPEGPVMVVGGAGYIGSHTVRLLQSRGVPCVVFDNLSTGHRQAIARDVPFVQADLADRGSIGDALKTHGIRSVIHFAAKCYVGESVTEPSKYYSENVFNTWNLLEEMRTHDVQRIVFSSTCATYGNPVQVPMDESHPQKPINPYGHTKLHMEHMMGDYSRAYGFSYAALRYFNAAGAAAGGCLGEHHEPETHLIPLVLQVALGQREFISVFGEDYPTPDGTCIRDYIHVDDLGDAHLRALCQLQAGARELHVNLGTGTGFSVKELIEMAREVTGHPIPARMAERRAGDPPQLVSGGTRAMDLLGWKPEKAALKRILEDAWAFHQKHPEGYH